MEFSNIIWEEFTREEHDKIMELISLGQVEHVAIVVENMTPQKERELQKIVNQIKPLVTNEESDVLDKYWKENPNGPQSPEEEKALQALIDTEILERQNKKRELNEERMSSLDNKPEEIKPVESKKFCDSCDSKGVRHLKTCPKFIPIIK